MNYFWLNCGYNRFNHFEDLLGQITVFDSSVHFNPSEGYTAFKRAQVGDNVIFYQVQNKIGLLGTGSVIKFEEPKRGQIKIHFQFEEKLIPLSKHYLERDPQLKQIFYKMKEQLLNPLTKSAYDQITAIGRGEQKINRYFLMKEMDNFEPDKEYTIFVRTVNGIERNGFKHYKEMDQGDQVIIYRTAPERGIYGLAEVVEGMHKKPVIAGRTDSTAVTIKYLKDIDHRTIYELDREPMLRAQYFINEKWNESVTEITKVQYDAMINVTPMTEQPTVSYAEQLAKVMPKKIISDYAGKYIAQYKAEEPLIHVYINDGGQDMQQLLKKKYTTDLPYYIADGTWTSGLLYGQYVQQDDQVTLHQGLLTRALAENGMIIDGIDRVRPELINLFIKAKQNELVYLPFEENGQAPILGRGRYSIPNSFRLIGIVKKLDNLQQSCPPYILKQMKFFKIK